MSFLRRLDAWLAGRVPDLAPPLPVSTSPIPTQRKAERTFPCCSCCLAFMPAPCPITHLTPCSRTECEQGWLPGGAA